MYKKEDFMRLVPEKVPGGYRIGPTCTSFGRSVTLVNPGDAGFWKHRYVLWFDTYGSTRLMVWADGLESALDEAIDWIVEHAPGLLCDDQVKEAYDEAFAEAKARGLSDEEAQEEAWEESETDTTTGGNCGNHINSWEWGIALEDPTRQELEDFCYPRNVKWEERDER